MNHDKLNRQAFGLLAGYFLQFLAGMTLNLFVKIPDTHPGNSGNNYFARSWHSLIWSISGNGGWVLSFHAIVALLLMLGSISLFVLAVSFKNNLWVIAGGIAALLTIAAFFNGMSFIDFNKDFSSMIMAVCWIGAVTALITGLLVSAKRVARTT